MIPSDSPCWNQARLLVEILPFVAEEDCFALKGGTAINFFVRDLPRLSVDIDLTYLPISDYDTSRREINLALRRIMERLTSVSPPYDVTVGDNDRSAMIDTLNVRSREVQVKIEVNPVIRGAIHAPQAMAVRPLIEEHIGFARMKMLAFDDLYAGKLVAAIDRQHPRDLFDVRVLFENEGFTDSLFRAFLVYLVGHKGTLADTLNPNRKPLEKLYRNQFESMANREVSIEQLVATREELIKSIHARLGTKEKRFLLSVKRREPEWELLGLEDAARLPAVKWKLHNLARMEKGAHQRAVDRLARLLDKI